MKSISCIAFLLLFLQLSFANEIVAPSKIKSVTVYLSGAQITRIADISVTKGMSEFKIDGLSPYVDEKSIQISGLKNTSIISMKYGINYLSEHTSGIDSDDLIYTITSLKDSIQSQNNLIAGYQEELEVIQKNRNFTDQTQPLSLERLKEFTLYYRERTTAINNEIHGSSKKIDDFKKQLQDIEKQLRERHSQEKTETGELYLKLGTSEPSETLKLTITYNIKNAGWFPIYDISAKNTDGPINFKYNAHVYQASGNNWNDIDLILSTGDPTTNNVKSDLPSKYLNFVSHNYSSSNHTVKTYNYKYNPTIKTVSGIVTDGSGQPLPGVNIIEKGTSNGTTSDFDGQYSLRVSNSEALTYSYVGMNSETLPIHSSVMNVSLIEDISALDEVMVTGYGARNSNGLGYAEEISKENITGIAPTNITEALSGRLAGLHVRGTSSIRNAKNPIYVVDGIIMRQKEVAENIDENMIAEIGILEQSKANAIYGNRSSGGVIIITTKSGHFTSTGNSIEEGITAISYVIEGVQSITSNNDIHAIVIDKFSLPANYQYYAAPIVNENVFLTAEVTSWEEYNLLPGEANVYFNGSYSGKSIIDPFNVSKKLTISLGVDPSIQVERKEIFKLQKTTFIGNNRVTEKQYQIEVKNNKSNAISLNLYDRIPISQNKEIKVEDIETKASEFNEKTGIMKWEIDLNSNENIEKQFSYTLKYPRYKRISL